MLIQKIKLADGEWYVCSGEIEGNHVRGYSTLSFYEALRNAIESANPKSYEE